MGAILTAAAYGAAIGGGLSLVQGGDLGDVLKGAALGGLAGGALSWAGGAIGAAAGAGSQAGMLASQTAGFTAAELAGWGGATAGASLGGTFGGQMAGLTASDLAGWGGATTADTAAVAGGGFWGGVQQAGDFLNSNKGLITVGQSLYGMTQAQAMQEQAMQMQQQANLWGNSGGQALGVAQLQQLMQDPEQLAATDPAYKLRLRAAQRATAGYGQNSGAMAVAGANASTDWYNQRMAQLAGVSGANVNPVGQSQVAMQGQIAGNNLMGESLASLAYGVGRKDWWSQQ